MENRDVSVGNWMVTMLLMAIPIVNIVMLFVWAFGGNVEKSKSNWAKAKLIWALISIVISIVLSITLGATIAALISSLY